MLIELRDVEVHIEPIVVVTKALEEGDLTIDLVIQKCIDEDGVESVLDSVDNDAILNYIQNYDLDIEFNTLDQMYRSIPELSPTDKAKLLWQLLKCEEN